MSHILDALQKLQEEKTAQLKQSAITGGILLDAGATRPKKHKRYLLAAIATVAILLGGATLWIMQRPKMQARPTAPLTEQQQLALQQPAMVVTPPPVAAPPPPTTPTAAPAVQPVAPTTPAQPNPDEDEEDRPKRRARQTNAPAASMAAPAPAAPVTVGTPEGVKLSGIAWHDNRKLRRAVVNDLLVGEGAEVAGARIVEIRTGLVKIEKNGTLFEVVLPH